MRPMTGKGIGCLCKVCVGRGNGLKAALKRMHTKQQRQKVKQVIEQEINEE